MIATAIRQEMARDGQVFFVHNRVESIYSLAHMVERLVPEARVAMAHGQMPEAELEKVMVGFWRGVSMSWCAPPSSKTAWTSPRPTP